MVGLGTSLSTGILLVGGYLLCLRCIFGTVFSGRRRLGTRVRRMGHYLLFCTLGRRRLLGRKCPQERLRELVSVRLSGLVILLGGLGNWRWPPRMLEKYFGGWVVLVIVRTDERVSGLLDRFLRLSASRRQRRFQNGVTRALSSGARRRIQRCTRSLRRGTRRAVSRSRTLVSRCSFGRTLGSVIPTIA